MTALEILKAARKLIEKDENWTQKAPARDEKGIVVYVDSHEACQWCASGALWKIQRGSGHWNSSIGWESEQAIKKAIKDLFGADSSIPRMNDCKTHQEVLAVFDKAIASLS